MQDLITAANAVNASPYLAILRDSYNDAVNAYADADTDSLADSAILWAARCVAELEHHDIADPGLIDIPAADLDAARIEMGVER